MLVYNTMRFGTDVLSTADSGSLGTRQALLTSNDALDATAVSAVNNFVITGEELTGTKRRVMLKIDDKIYRFVSGMLTEYTGGATVDNVLANGNTVAELTALSNISALVGKEIYPIIALSSTGDDNPTITIGLNTTTSTEKKTFTGNTAIYELPVPEDGSTPIITSAVADITTEGAGEVTIQIRLKNTDGVWGDWINLDDAETQEATRVQFRFTFFVENVGTDSAQVKSITVNYVSNNETVTGDTAELYSIVPNFETDLRLCYVIVRHKQLVDSTIEAFANFLPAYKTRERIQVGTGTNAAAQYTLGVSGTPDSQIDPSSIRVYVDGNLIDDFDYNTAAGQITVNAASGVSILASYHYDCGTEDWQAMSVETQQPYGDGTYMTRFSYTLPDGEDAQRANIRLRFNRPAGSVTNQSLGKATGKTQQIVLPHLATTSTIELNADWSYDFDSRVLTFVAKKNTALKISYDYVGEQHQIYSWAAGWSAA